MEELAVDDHPPVQGYFIIGDSCKEQMSSYCAGKRNVEIGVSGALRRKRSR